MLQHQIDADDGIITVIPSRELTADDFRKLTDVVDEYNSRHQPLQALMILTEHFPGWDSFGALFQHMKFIRHQRAGIKKVAAVTDSGFLTVMPHIVDHFIKAEIRHFAYTDKDQALEWLRS
jgi:hypothetical protein